MCSMQSMRAALGGEDRKKERREESTATERREGMAQYLAEGEAMGWKQGRRKAEEEDRRGTEARRMVEGSTPPISWLTVFHHGL